ncbi:MAG: flagellar biosynthesis protein [Planctomycetota bacterium]|nr:MAG: flagellar biosynthesis protein [Planctomycetota bacterium]
MSPETLQQDQAAELRRLVAQRAKQAPRAMTASSARVIAVTSGKGGVGKTNLAVNLAVAAAAYGKRVALVDLDLGLANADVVLGASPKATIAHVLSGRVNILQALTPTHGVMLLAGASGIESYANLTAPERERLRDAFGRLAERADLVILDTGAGISRNVIEFAAAADEALVVTTPEPTALVDAYATVKLLAREPDAGAIRLIVNQAADRAEADRVSAGLISVARRFLQADVDRLGYVLRDPAVGRAVMARAPFVVAEGRGAAAECVRNLAARLIGGVPRRRGFVQRVFQILRLGA